MDTYTGPAVIPDRLTPAEIARTKETIARMTERLAEMARHTGAARGPRKDTEDE